MSLPPLDTLTGCLLVGTWASSLLYMFEISQIWYYFQNFKQDDRKFKTLVTTSLVVDTMGMVGDYICVYLYTITHAGDAEYLFSMHWPMPFYVLDTGVLAVMVQAFLVFRYWRFTRNTLIALFLCFGIIISFGGVLTGTLMATLYTSLADRPKFEIPIATLDRLTAITIQSGAAATTIAGATLIAYYMKPESNVAVGVSYPLRRVYVITLLSNLNIRKSAKSFSTTTGRSSGPGTTGGEREATFTCWATDDSCGIHAHRAVHTSAQMVQLL
ncbi:hypothetical protein DFH08DRAFT_955673 [Mycena albidolilacea]|uniref:DUF6534 domain-containing protein n=1 Tax=Mycena albidolilacea TaxID=1033008 RepID=A0AAD7ABN1_9AGAR|nr:hypothetical protein DFH08DRAFT_955673 [Mycena albidolilacea]